MKVLITGSSGAPGRILTGYLISRKISVAGLDIREPVDLFTEDQGQVCIQV
jgi:nucleoside-diphosphate-sugar epimerase